MNRQGSSGILLVLGGTLVSSASGFGVLAILAPHLGAQSFASFSIFWSTLFFFAAISMGIQQEATRISAEMSIETVDTKRRGASLLLLSLFAAGVLSGVAALYSLTLRVDGGAFVTTWLPALVVGIASYAFLASFSGMAAGRSRWGKYSSILFVDGSLRFVLVVIWALQGWSLAVLPWVIVLPFLVAILVFVLLGRRLISSTSVTSLGWPELTKNVLKVIAGAAASAALVNGFPALLGFFVTRQNQAEIGSFILVLLLTRAPILLLVGAAQTYLIKYFTLNAGKILKQCLAPMAAVAALTVLLFFGGLLFGREVIVNFFGSEYALEPLAIAGLVASSGFIGLLTITGAAAIAADRHSAYAIGWVVAFIGAMLTVLVFQQAVPLGATLGLIFGPLAGVVVHLLAVRKRDVSSRL